MYSAWYTLHSVQCIAYSVYCIVFSVHHWCSGFIGWRCDQNDFVFTGFCKTSLKLSIHKFEHFTIGSFGKELVTEELQTDFLRSSNLQVSAPYCLRGWAADPPPHSPPPHSPPSHLLPLQQVESWPCILASVPLPNMYVPNTLSKLPTITFQRPNTNWGNPLTCWCNRLIPGLGYCPVLYLPPPPLVTLFVVLLKSSCSALYSSLHLTPSPT